MLLLGASGLLGSTLVPFLVSRGYVVETHSKSGDTKYQTDISKLSNAYELFENIQPTIIINLIGLTDVDYCENNPNLAYLSNVKTTENIAKWISQKKMACHLVHISTDHLYDNCGLHTEAEVTLTNYYAFSKYAGELAAISVPSTVLRTNFLGRSRCSKKSSLTDWLHSSLSTNASIKVFEDVLFSPLDMDSLAKMIDLCIQKKPIGIFNLGSNEGMSKAEFAFAFAAALNLSTSAMSSVKSEETDFLKAYRPKDMRMDCSKFEKELGIQLPKLTDLIQQIAKEYDETTKSNFRNPR